MQKLNIPKLANHEVDIFLMKHGMIAVFPMINSMTPTFVSIDNGRTWSVIARDIKGDTIWESKEIELQGQKLDATITRMYKENKFGDPTEAIEVVHIMMVRSLSC